MRYHDPVELRKAIRSYVLLSQGGCPLNEVFDMFLSAPALSEVSGALMDMIQGGELDLDHERRLRVVNGGKGIAPPTGYSGDSTQHPAPTGGDP